MAKVKPTWFINAVTDSDDDKGRWTRIGVGFNNPKSKTITLYSDVWPYKVVLTEYKEPPKKADSVPEMDAFSMGTYSPYFFFPRTNVTAETPI